VRLLFTALALVLSLTPAASRQLTAIRVSAGEDLQAALRMAHPGDTILLEAGALFIGNFELPNHGELPTFITIRSDGSELPAPGVRTGPAHRSQLATLKSPNNTPALRTAPGAHHWRIENVAFAANRGGFGDILTLGHGGKAQSAVDAVPHSLVLDRLLIEGDPEAGQKRGIALNSATTEIRNSYIADIKARGQDSQGIAGWNGPGPYLIENNYIEGAAENILFGGSDSFIDGLVPSDIVIRGNHLSKPVAWRGSRWTVKNLLELKNARRVRIEGNILEYNWLAGQDGYAILIKPENQAGGAPWSTIEDVTFTNNWVRHVSAALNINGRDTSHVSERARGIVISNNLFEDVDAAAWGGTGDFVKIGNGPADLVIEDNTVINSGRIINVYGPAGGDRVDGFVFRRNVVRHNRYGVKGQATATGVKTIEHFFPDGIFTGNIIGGDTRFRYPPGNRFVAREEVGAGASFSGAGVQVPRLETAIGVSTSAPDAPVGLPQSSN
jgi:hypothetical protein